MNRLITSLILGFVVTSLLVVLLPLLQSGSGAPLVSFLTRDSSLVLYASFLSIFLGFVLPVFMARDSASRPVAAWGAVAGYVLLFAAIPLIFTAYISGVSIDGLVTIGALCATVPGVGLVLRRWGGRAALAVSLVLASVFLFVLPGLLLYRESVGMTSHPLFTTLSPMNWLFRVARARELPDFIPFIVLSAVLWGGALVPRFRFRRAAASGSVAVLLILGLAFVARPEVATRSVVQGVPGLSIESMAGNVCRAGFRTPLRVRMDPAGGKAEIRLGDWVTFVPADGQPHTVLAIPGLSDTSITVRLGTSTQVVPLPAEAVPPDQALAALIGVDEKRAEGLVSRARIASLGTSPRAMAPGSLEAFDAVVVSFSTFTECGTPARETLERYASLGGRLVLLDESAAEASFVTVGTGHRITMPARLLDNLEFRRQTAGLLGALDTGLIQTFASPRWQEMDLSALLLFAVVYHVAFLLAFLLPLLIDSRKTVTVYLVSVGFVVIAMALLAFNVLQDIFLKKNQVYTQSITLLVQSAGPDARLAGRQFLCYASMSEETRDLSFASDVDLVPYRPEAGGLTTRLDQDSEGQVLRNVKLDRRQRKTLVRVDRVGVPPFRLAAPTGTPGRLRLEPVPGAVDHWGLLAARKEHAFLVEGGARARRFRIVGRDLLEEGPAEGIAGSREVFLRKLLGRFAPPFKRYLLIVASGLRRPDQTEQYLWVRDLGAFLIIPLPDP